MRVCVCVLWVDCVFVRVCVAARQIKNFVSRLFPNIFSLFCAFFATFCTRSPTPVHLLLLLLFFLWLLSLIFLLTLLPGCELIFSAFAVAIVVVVGRRNGKLSNNVVHNLNRICCVACATHAPSPSPSPPLQVPLFHHLSPHTHTHS